MKKIRCKTGDLAVVIDALYKCNLGAVVQVIEMHNGFGDIRYFNRFCSCNCFIYHQT
jgi:hypothetical protein